MFSTLDGHAVLIALGHHASELTTVSRDTAAQLGEGTKKRLQTRVPRFTHVLAGVKSKCCRWDQNAGMRTLDSMRREPRGVGCLREGRSACQPSTVSYPGCSLLRRCSSRVPIRAAARGAPVGERGKQPRPGTPVFREAELAVTPVVPMPRAALSKPEPLKAAKPRRVTAVPRRAPASQATAGKAR